MILSANGEFEFNVRLRFLYFVRSEINSLRDCILDFSTNVPRVAEKEEVDQTALLSRHALPSAFSISNLPLRVGNNRNFLDTRTVVVPWRNDFAAIGFSYFQYTVMQKSNKIIEFFVNFLT